MFQRNVLNILQWTITGGEFRQILKKKDFICFQKVTLAISKVRHLPPLCYGHVNLRWMESFPSWNKVCYLFSSLDLFYVKHELLVQALNQERVGLLKNLHFWNGKCNLLKANKIFFFQNLSKFTPGLCLTLFRPGPWPWFM
jgi:hypothetical protein